MKNLKNTEKTEYKETSEIAVISENQAMTENFSKSDKAEKTENALDLNLSTVVDVTTNAENCEKSVNAENCEKSDKTREKKDRLKSRYKKNATYVINIIMPALIFGSLTGFLTAAVVVFYKFCAKHIIKFSEITYDFIRDRLYLVPLALIALFLIAVAFSEIYKRYKNLKGGGIPTTVGFLRGIFTFKWARNLLGIFVMSLGSFFIGVPLGNEGPSVQMGASVGKGIVDLTSKKHKAWERYTMTAGGCGGFTTATGAPISGIMFSVEDAHRRITPMILMVTFVSVAVSYFTSLWLSPLLGVSPRLFEELSLIEFSFKDCYIPIIIGLSVGLLSVLALKYYKYLNLFFNKTLKKVPAYIKIFICFAITFAVGLFSRSFISTGHELTETLLVKREAIWFLILILVMRSTLTLSANSNGITGGLFLPIIAIGAVMSAIFGEIAIFAGLDEKYYTAIVMLGIAACMASTMKTPLTAIVFAVEALSCYTNILSVVAVVAIAYAISEIFDVKSMTDTAIENRVEELKREKPCRVFEITAVAKPKSFVIGKQIRDILWPYNCVILSSKRQNSDKHESDHEGDSSIHEGDLLNIRLAVYEEERALEELKYLLGDQNLSPVYVETE